MTRAAKISNVGAVMVPFLAFVGAIVLLWNSIVGPSDLVVLAVMYLLTGFGVTIGFHRMLTHRSFQTSKPVEYVFAVLGSMSVQGPVINWVADHRKHHAHTDEEGDPHSPHLNDGHGSGVRGMLHGLFHAHIGWLMTEHGQARRTKYARDLMDDPGMRSIHRAFVPIVLAGFALPAVLGFALTGGEPAGALTGLLWGGFVRVFLLHHVTWSINSICHVFGRRRFATDDHSTNVFWLALPSLGEAWHHNHHAFPRAAVHGLRRTELDPSGWVIGVMERLGLAWDVVRIAPERQRARLSDAPAG
jgi:stearoyl-CoA desaturase (delta-9 desaturase)